MLKSIFKKTNYQLRLEKKQQKQEEIQKALEVSEIIKTAEKPEEAQTLSQILRTDDEILKTLKSIEENMVDEQDTSIKRVPESAKDIKDNPEGIVDDSQSKPSGILGMIGSLVGPLVTGLLGGVAGLGLWKFLGKMGRLPFELLGKIFTGGITAIPGLTKVISEITESVLKSVGKLLEPILKYMKPLIADLAAKTAPKVALDSIKTVAKPTVMAKTVEKILGKNTMTVLKTGVKKLPLIGLLAGIGFGMQRAFDGDFLGAGMEVFSGAVSMIPGVGTAASFATDAALLARDVMNGGEIEVSRYNENLAANSRSRNSDYSAIDGTFISDLSRHNLDDSLVRMVKKNEGFRAEYYPDAHGYSIGYGHFSKGSGSVPVSQILGYDPGNSITREEAEILLQHDIAKAQTGLFNRFPWVKDKPKVVQNNLTDMTYNMGLGGISQFKETLALIEKSEYSEAAKRLVKSKWYSQVGDRAKNIVSDFNQLGKGENATESTEADYHMVITKKAVGATTDETKKSEVESNKDAKTEQVTQVVNNITEKTKVSNVTQIIQSKSPVQTIQTAQTNSGNVNIQQNKTNEIVSILDMFIL